MSIFHDAGKLGVFLLQLSPAFSPRKHELGELIQLIEMLSDYDLAIEFRNRNWAVGDQLESTIDFVRKHHATFVNVDAPASDHFMVMPSDVDEVTNSKLAYLRLHGRNEKAYITSKTADTPHSIALGSAIGIFFGFTPLYPLKTLLSIAVAWVCRCNKIAAAIAVTLHDVLIWAMPAIYVAEYHLGCWTLDRPAARRIHLRQFGLRDYIDWHVFSRVVWPAFWPAFVGSLFLAVPSAIIIYFVMRLLVSRARMPQKTA